MAQGKTGADGQLTLTVPSLRTNASFQATGPGGVKSAEVSIVVTPQVTVSVVASPRGRTALLVVAAPLARRGDVVDLEALSGSGWQVIRVHRLHKGGRAAFTVAARKTSVTYQVVLPATARHGQAASVPVIVPARVRH